MKRVLIATYYWPPGSGPGVQRFLKFAKYLPEYGWLPTIITVENGTYPSRDESLEAEVPKEVKVIRTKTFEPFALFNKLTGKDKKEATVGFTGVKQTSPISKLALYIRANYFIPDARKGWLPHLKAAIDAEVKCEHYDAIITTGPPHSTHLAGRYAQGKHQILWIADMRDPWVNVYYNALFPRTASTQRKDQALEDLILKSADGVTVVSSGLKAEFENRAKEIEVIYNGFDSVDMQSGGQDLKRNLAYIGNFKPNQNVDALWKALEGMKNPPEISLTGNLDPSVLGSIQEHGLADLTKVEGFVPHQEATKKMRESGCLLFIVPKAEGNKSIITGKLFEYLASGRSLLAIGPRDGDAAKIIKEASGQIMFDYEDVEGIQERLNEIFKAYDAGEPTEVIGQGLEKFSRKGLTHELAKMLNSLPEK